VCTEQSDCDVSNPLRADSIGRFQNSMMIHFDRELFVLSYGEIERLDRID